MADDNSTPGAAGDAASSAQEGMRNATASGEAMMKGGAQLGLAMLDQAESNTQKAFEAMRAAARANDISEVMKIQSDFLRDQGNRSMAQAREIGELISSFGRTALGQMTGRR